MISSLQNTTKNSIVIVPSFLCKRKYCWPASVLKLFPVSVLNSMLLLWFSIVSFILGILFLCSPQRVRAPWAISSRVFPGDLPQHYTFVTNCFHGNTREPGWSARNHTGDGTHIYAVSRSHALPGSLCTHHNSPNNWICFMGERIFLCFYASASTGSLINMRPFV